MQAGSANSLTISSAASHLWLLVGVEVSYDHPTEEETSSMVH